MIENVCPDDQLFDQTLKVCSDPSSIISRQPWCSQSSNIPTELNLLLNKVHVSAQGVFSDLENYNLNASYIEKMKTLTQQFKEYSKLTIINDSDRKKIFENAKQFFIFTQTLTEYSHSFSSETNRKLEELRSVLNKVLFKTNYNYNPDYQSNKTLEKLKKINIELEKLQISLDKDEAEDSNYLLAEDYTQRKTRLNHISHQINEILYQYNTGTIDKTVLISKLREIREEIKSFGPSSELDLVQSILTAALTDLGWVESILKDEITCDISLIHIPVPGDCSSFYQCTGVPGSPGKRVKKKCGPGTMFNPVRLICDWPLNVYKINPDCNIKQTTTSSIVYSTEPPKVQISTLSRGDNLAGITSLNPNLNIDSSNPYQSSSNPSDQSSNPYVAGGLLFTIPRYISSPSPIVYTTGNPVTAGLPVKNSTWKTDPTLTDPVLLVQSTKSPPLACPEER